MMTPDKQPGDFAVGDTLVGKTIGRFTVRERLGGGGMGEVYRAHDSVLDREVALKRMAPRFQEDQLYRRLFMKEAQRASQFSHPHIAGVYDVFEESGASFLVMEMIEGTTLRSRLRAGGATATSANRLELPEFFDVAIQCCEGLGAAHSRGIVHCDLKPENIMVTIEGRVKILDFGVARRADAEDPAQTLTSLPVSGGTAGYMAPEVLLRNEFDARADIFALGVIFYELVTGCQPFTAATVTAISDQVLHVDPVPLRQLNPAVPAAVEAIVERMMAKDCAARYASAAEVAADLRAVLESPGGLPPRLRDRAATEPRLLRHRRMLWTTAGALALVTLALVLVLTKWKPADRPNTVAGAAQRKHVAVLPFACVGGEGTRTAFCDGFTYLVTSKLTQLEPAHKWLFVVPANEVMSSGVKTADVARERFGVNLVVTGSLQRSGEGLVLSATLTDAEKRHTLQSFTLQASVTAPVALENVLAMQLASALAISVEPETRRLFGSGESTVASARDAYIEGWGYFQEYDKPENVDRALALFRKAAQEDPRFALGHAGVGHAAWQKYKETQRKEWVAESRAACEQAVALESDLGSGHTCLGMVYAGTGRYEQAVEQFNAALGVEPTSEQAYRGLASTYGKLKEPQQAEKTYLRAISLRPNYWAGYNWLGVFYFNAARYPEAAEMFEHVVKMSRDNFLAYRNLGGAYLLDGRYDAGIRALQRAIELRPNDRSVARAHSNLAFGYFNTRRFDDAARHYERAAELEPGDYVLWANLGDARYWAPARRAEAAPMFEKALALATAKLQVDPRDAQLHACAALYHAMLQRRKPALQALKKALALDSANHNVLYKAARIHNEFGDRDATLRYLEAALAAGYPASDVRDTPIFDNLRPEPRFQKLLQAKAALR